MRFNVIMAIAVLTMHGVARAEAPTSRPAAPIGADEGLFSYRFEPSTQRCSDILTLNNGQRLTGKVMEWGTQILLSDGAGRLSVFEAADVREFRLRRWPRNQEKPNMPDLTVAYVERTPRDPHWHGSVAMKGGLPTAREIPEAERHPARGSKVTFKVHVRNAGAKQAEACQCEFRIDDQVIHNADVPAIAPGAEQVVEAAWTWDSGEHVLSIRIDPEGKLRESQRWNNRFDERTDADPLTFVVAKDRFEAFAKTPSMVDSFCIEDWIQYHVRMTNALLSASVYPSAPTGILARVRCDRIVVADDPADARLRERVEFRRGGKADGPAEFAGLIALGRLSENETPATSALYADWRIPRRIGEELGLIDLACTDTTLEQCRVRDINERYVVRRHLFPWPATMMYAAGPYTFDEVSAGYLNQSRGLPRGLPGSYLYQTPEKIVLDVRANDGSPVTGLQIDVFQLMADGEDAGTIYGIGPTDPVARMTTDERGRAPLPDQPNTPAHRTADGYALRPNPFGTISTDGHNALLLLRLRRGGAEEYHFLRLYDCLLAYLRGSRKEYVHVMNTRFGPIGALAPSKYTAVRIGETVEEGWPKLKVGWMYPEGMDDKELEEFAVIKRVGLLGDEAGQWTYVEPVGRTAHGLNLDTAIDYFEDTFVDRRDSLDSFFHMTCVDRLGRVGDPSAASGYLAWGKDCISFAVDPDSQAYIAVAGDGPVPLVYFNPYVGLQPCLLHARRFPGYRPRFAGLAFTQDRRLIAADPVNHVLAIYDRGDLDRVIPAQTEWPGRPGRGDGEFHTPMDVAVDDRGNIYVADYANDRVQILDYNGRYKALLDPDFGFLEPSGLTYSSGFLCVSDHGGERVRVYEVGSSGAPKFLRQLPPMKDVDRALADRAGKIMVPGRDPQTKKWAILVYAPDGDSAKFEKAILKADIQTGEIDRPRGLCAQSAGGADYAYFVNAFPFTIRRVVLQEAAPPTLPP